MGAPLLGLPKSIYYAGLMLENKYNGSRCTYVLKSEDYPFLYVW